MQSASFRMISTTISILLLAALVLVILLAFRDNSTTALQIPPTKTPPVTSVIAESQPTVAPVTPTAQVARVAFGQPRRVESGGFAFRPLTSYVLELARGSATLDAGSDSSAVDAVFVLSGGLSTDFINDDVTTLADAFQQVVELYSAEEDLKLGESNTFSVNGVAGLAVEVMSNDPIQNIAGRISVVQPTEDRLFVMEGLAPAEQWNQQAQADYEAVLNSVTFFELAVASLTPERVARATPAAPLTSSGATKTVQEEIDPTATTDNITAPPTVTTPTPQAASDVSPTPSSQATREGVWEVYSNGDFSNDVAVIKSTLWSATGGGVVAWNKSSENYVKFTTVDGLSTNHTTAAESCSLTGLGMLFATPQGLQVFDTQNGSWKTMNSDNSPMSFDDIAALHCDAGNGFLVVAYSRHGLDIFDEESGDWTHVDKSDGLEYNNIRDITVIGDRKAIWVASDEGASVLESNGNTELHNTENSPLASDQVNVIVADSLEGTWLASAGTLYRTNGVIWREYDQETVSDGDFPNGTITGLGVATDDTIWVASDQGQVCHFDPEEEQCIAFFSNEEGMSAGPLTRLRVDADDNVYYTTAGSGISMYDGERWKQFEIGNEVIPGNTIRHFTQDENDLVWVGALGGAAQLDPDSELDGESFTPENSPLPGMDVRVIEPGSMGSIWFGIDGATYYDGDTWTTYTMADGLAGADVQAITSDSQNRTWLGTKSGLSIWTGSAFFNLTSENGLPSDDITALQADDDVVWIGTRDGGLLRFQDNQLQVFNSANADLPSDSITVLAIHNDGSMLLGTDQGLARFSDNQIIPVEELGAAEIRALVTAPNGEIWVANGENELFRFDGTNWNEFTNPQQLPSSPITALLVDKTGTLWIGSEQGGLVRYIP